MKGTDFLGVFPSPALLAPGNNETTIQLIRSVFLPDIVFLLLAFGIFRHLSKHLETVSFGQQTETAVFANRLRDALYANYARVYILQVLYKPGKKTCKKDSVVHNGWKLGQFKNTNTNNS
jgi:hypothetical protein